MNNHGSLGRNLLNKVPEITIFFWIIKVLCTTVGETAADFLNVNLNLGLTITSIIMGVIFLVVLFVQFKTKKYTPVVYWLTVGLISVFGTLVTDNISDNLHIPLQITTIIFTVLLASTFAGWYVQEKTLSIHSIYTRKREAFYWLTIFFTFALGTASGDLMAESLGLGYLTTGIIIAAVITLFAIGWRLGLNAIISFWFIYILTRPLGASIGDVLTQSPQNGGLGLGPTVTTMLFLAGIVLSVLYLSLTNKDVIKDGAREERIDTKRGKNAFVQLAVVLITLLTVSIGGYQLRHQQLQNASRAQNATGIQNGPLGDLSNFIAITQAMTIAVQKGDFATAATGANDLEHAWDTSQAVLKPMNLPAWTYVDGGIDKMLREIRAVTPNQKTTLSALSVLAKDLKNP
jgi:uncharacterized membrane-anchored protein